MSSQRGNVSRTRPQKHKNQKAFKNNLHDTTKVTQMLNNLQITGCCEKCKAVIEWKIKYKKYKPLSQPKTCTSCHQKTIRRAYYILCESCSSTQQRCAKCGESKEVVLRPELSSAEVDRQQNLFEQELSSLPEKKRRKFLRLLAKGELSSKELLTSSSLDIASDHESDGTGADTREEDDFDEQGVEECVKSDLDERGAEMADGQRVEGYVEKDLAEQGEEGCVKNDSDKQGAEGCVKDDLDERGAEMTDEQGAEGCVKKDLGKHRMEGCDVKVEDADD